MCGGVIERSSCQGGHSGQGDITIGSIKVQIRRHVDKETKIEVPTDIFVAWGRQVEKTTPLSERELTKFFDTKHQDFMASIHAEAEEKRRQADEQARQQKLLEEQQRQQAELREREEQHRRFEEMRRQQEQDNQRLVEEQRRKMAMAAEAKYFGEAQNSWAHGGSIGVAGALTSAAAAADVRATGNVTAAQTHGDPMAGVSALGLNAAAATYPQQAAAAQWGAVQQQWIQAMAYHSQQQAQAQAAQGWTQQMAAAAQQRAIPQMQNIQGMAPQQAYYHAYMAEQQQRGQGAAAAAYAQAQAAQAQQGAYAQPSAAFNYGAAAYGRGGERI